MRHRTLTVLTVAAVVAALVVPLGAQAERRPMRMMVGDVLDLTAEQEAKLDALAEKHWAARKDLFDRTAKLRDEMDELLRSPDYDLGKAEGLIDETARLRAEQQKAGLRYRLEMRNVLTPEQLKKLDAYRGAFGRDRRVGMRPSLGRGAGRFDRFDGRGWRMRFPRRRW
ncbi:MAG: Spy/CpxP family protein refolding chaperone [Candidatus Aminicenantes bacterium]|nr:Spy/CpxP family protein refolding chaperone [Candidatus Aminicenantes bacterium]